MKLFLTITFFTAGLFLHTGSLVAKERTCRIAAPERPLDAPRVVYLFDGTKTHRVALPSMNLSPVIELPKGEITIVLSPDKISDPEALPAAVARLKIPQGVTDFYILVTSNPENKKFPVGMKLIDVGAGKLKQGETLWLNHTPHKVIAKLGDAKVEIKPMARTLSNAPAAKSGYFKAAFAYQANGKGVVAPITEQNWWHDANSRHLGFVISSGGRLPKICYFRDFRLKE